MNVKRILAITAGLVGLLIVFVWLANGFTPKLDTQARAEQNQVKPETALVRSEAMEQHRAFSGTVQARQQAAISARITARVAEVLVNAGDRVEAGDVLLRLENADLSSRVRQQEQTLAAAQARANEARLSFQRIEAVVAQGVLPEASLDEARATRDSAEADLIRARESLSEARTSESFSVILAPFAGIVSRRAVFTGDTATPGMLLVGLYQPESLRLEAAISESVLTNINIGDELKISLDAVNKTLAGRIVEIEPAADSASRSFIIRLVPATVAGLYPGMYGTVSVPAGSREITHIPVASVTQIGQLNYVQVWRNNRLERRLVRLGEVLNYQGAQHVEVAAGLQAGEEVAISR
ncbi:RND family efflux transporter, MFP subunit [Idiomarina sp. A28L]|uniref:efflux RND transporter periplasmic adaptor subunit n=1 Tax=Idiomarina sp. A28L TaxID=1036674 RepID=UPI0002138B79|nr:efflux RND transporter periplasmic adaptor subunit [Idiomarina sp. A28L]EGN75946.1 RND family efflux transporter, MFP subunit [Idiomarina sp. A28L]